MRLSAQVMGMLLFGAVGVLNLAPGLIALMPAKLSTTYGVLTTDATAILLLRHRAVMLAVLGTALVAVAFLSNLRIPVLAAAAVGKLSFIALVLPSRGAHPQLTPVAFADIMALVVLVAAAVLTRAWTARP
ncbi:hypothetical protein GCM10009555_098630 [Acrocarpospora macrocephala]|uniref:Phosphopantetheine adenylyltransferase n=1 Tax=Acrocarpospora macrocephala TaxID=150177 RepID=A0A5M3X4Q0_9ACTN|nr:hypothetical protein [Acrocarpospora macrocephala]GES16685.1 hypothetical protein Amac_102830 [Acrocarpospora macrocephala]